MEVEQARRGQIETHKRKLDAQRSLSKGGSLTAYDALERIKTKRRKEADGVLRKAKRAIELAENKTKKALKDRGIQARKDERARLATIKQQHILRIELPASIWDPIIDPTVNLTSVKKEPLRANQSLYDNLEPAQQEWNRVQSEDPTQFTSIAIDPAILEMERQFELASQRSLFQVQIDVDSEQEEGSQAGSNVVSPPRSVATIDSIAENADFIELE
jgi:hypothetical protein